MLTEAVAKDPTMGQRQRLQPQLGRATIPPSTRLASAVSNFAKTSAEEKATSRNGWIKAKEDEEC